MMRLMSPTGAPSTNGPITGASLDNSVAPGAGHQGSDVLSTIPSNNFVAHQQPKNNRNVSNVANGLVLSPAINQFGNDGGGEMPGNDPCASGNSGVLAATAPPNATQLATQQHQNNDPPIASGLNGHFVEGGEGKLPAAGAPASAATQVSQQTGGNPSIAGTILAPALDKIEEGEEVYVQEFYRIVFGYDRKGTP